MAHGTVWRRQHQPCGLSHSHERGAVSPLLSSALSRDHAIFALASIVLVLEHLHARHYIYRDVKPENVLVGADGYLKVVDFGFAKHVAPSERTFTVCGTL